LDGVFATTAGMVYVGAMMTGRRAKRFGDGRPGRRWASVAGGWIRLGFGYTRAVAPPPSSTTFGLLHPLWRWPWLRLLLWRWWWQPSRPVVSAELLAVPV